MFPRVDPEIDESWYVDTRSQTEKYFDIVCNSLSLLNEGDFAHWNELCARDCNFLEKSKLGLYCTEYDIKDQQRIFKAKQSKMDYIEKLGNEKVKKSNRRNLKLNFS